MTYLANSLAERGGDAASLRFPYDAFERAFLRLTDEINPTELLPPDENTSFTEDRGEALKGRLTDIDHRLLYSIPPSHRQYPR